MNLWDDRRRLDDEQVTDFLEATDICLALLRHQLATAPEWEDEALLEEIATYVFALRRAQEVAVC